MEYTAPKPEYILPPILTKYIDKIHNRFHRVEFPKCAYCDEPKVFEPDSCWNCWRLPCGCEKMGCCWGGHTEGCTLPAFNSG